jgi:putative tricarboxylic transport membrane protein
MQWSDQPSKGSCLAVALVAAVVLLASTFGAWSQRAIRMILPFAPGGPADAMARILAEQIGTTGGPAMIVEPHPGAATVIGTELVSRAAPDGNTLGIVSNSFIMLPHLRKVNYDPFKSFEPICRLAGFVSLVVVNGDSPYHTLADLIAAAHGRPGALTLGTIGPATASHIAFVMLSRAANADMTFVPFNGYTAAIQSLLGNHITAAIADYSSLQGELKAGALRALATTARTRAAILPDVPTIIESGYQDVAAEFFGGVVAPAKTPPQIITQLSSLFTAAMQAPKIKEKFAALGFYPGGECGADFAALLRRDNEDYGRVIRDANIKLE